MRTWSDPRQCLYRTPGVRAITPYHFAAQPTQARAFPSPVLLVSSSVPHAPTMSLPSDRSRRSLSTSLRWQPAAIPSGAYRYNGHLRRRPLSADDKLSIVVQGHLSQAPFLAPGRLLCGCGAGAGGRVGERFGRAGLRMCLVGWVGQEMAGGRGAQAAHGGAYDHSHVGPFGPSGHAVWHTLYWCPGARMAAPRARADEPGWPSRHPQCVRRAEHACAQSVRRMTDSGGRPSVCSHLWESCSHSVFEL